MPDIANSLPAWSYSFLDQFANCPRQAYHRYILKEKGVETEAQREGNLFDKAVEDYLLKDTPLPEKYLKFKGYADSLKQAVDVQLYAQLKLGIKRDFTPSDFFGKEVWGRGVLDVALVKKRSLGNPNVAIITDWKTGKSNEGKPYSNNGLQLKIFSLLLFCHFPGVEKITAFNLWLKDMKPGKVYSFVRGDRAALWKEVLPRIMAMEKAFATQSWPESPGPLCGYCDVTSCKYNRK